MVMVIDGDKFDTVTTLVCNRHMGGQTSSNL